MPSFSSTLARGSSASSERAGMGGASSSDFSSVLAAAYAEQIQSPSMTAEWEEKLLGIEKGGYAPDSFMREIAGMVTDLVKNYETVKGVEINMPGNSSPPPW